MIKTKLEKGITLIALIITIVILLVIVSVAIGTIKNEKIIGHSQIAVEQFNEAQFKEKIELIFLSYNIEAKTKASINNKKVTNEILDIFEYPNINIETGDLLDEQEGTTDFFTMTAENGRVNVKNNSTSETILGVTYDKENKPKFTIMYKDLVYKYDNYKLAKVDYYVNGNSSDWVYYELDDGTVKIIGYKGEGEPDSKEPGVYNLTIPNRIDGMHVSQVDILSGGDVGYSDEIKNTSIAKLGKINGTLTFSYGLKNPKIRDNIPMENLKKIVLKENVINPEVQTASGVTDIYISSGCEVRSIIPQNNLVNVVMEDKLTFLENSYNNLGRNFSNCPNLSEESVTEILAKANNYTEQMFYLINFPEGFRINFPEKANITASNLFLFRGGTTIKEINIRDNSKIIGSTKLFDTQAGVTIKNLNIGKNCTVRGLIVNGQSIPTINKLTIGEHTTIKGWYGAYLAVIKEIDISDNVVIEKYGFHTCTDIEKITLGKNVTIEQDGFRECTFADGAIVEMYLTDEQKADNSKIPTLWFESTGEFTKTVGAEKVTWTKN